MRYRGHYELHVPPTLPQALQNAKSKLPPSYKDHLTASTGFKLGIHEFLYDWRDHAHQEELKARSHIPKYSDGELERFAEHLAQTDEENL